MIWDGDYWDVLVQGECFCCGDVDVQICEWFWFYVGDDVCDFFVICFLQSFDEEVVDDFGMVERVGGCGFGVLGFVCIGEGDSCVQ